MHRPINVKSPNNISKWQMGFNSAFKGLISYRTHLVTNHSFSSGSSLQSPATVSGRIRLYTLFTRLLACTNLFLRVFHRLRFLLVPCIPVCLSSGDSATFPCRTARDGSKPDRCMINCNPTAHKYMATTHELPVSRMTSRHVLTAGIPPLCRLIGSPQILFLIWR
jgi:hypothetical protein